MERESSGKWGLVPADHSDCFGGSDRFTNGVFLAPDTPVEPAPPLKGQLAVMLELGGAQSVRTAIDMTSTCLPEVNEVLDCVPSQWWNEAGIERAAVARSLADRGQRLSEALKPDSWGDYDARDIPIIGSGV